MPPFDEVETFESVSEVASSLRTTLEKKNSVLVYAHNGVGKTRLSMAFKDLGKSNGHRDTLYYNAFTEDLFIWDNDLVGDTSRKLTIRRESHFFDGLDGLDIQSLVRTQLGHYADFKFHIDTELWEVSFSRDVKGGQVDEIKVSRSEENLFIWCFFLAILQLVIDGAVEYDWVRYVYVDDPVSSLDEHNAIHLATRLAHILKEQSGPREPVRAVVSSHHTLFFNVIAGELSNAKRYMLRRTPEETYSLAHTGVTPLFQHLLALQELKEVADTGQLFTYHFNILRGILEKVAFFHGLDGFGACVVRDDDDTEGKVHKRIINVLNHQGHTLFEPILMAEENKKHFTKVLNDTLNRFPFNPALFSTEPTEVSAA